MQKMICLFLVCAFLAACTSTGTGTPVNSTTETPISIPSITPAAAAPLAIAVIPSDMDQEIANLYQTAIYDLTQEQGFRFQTRSSLTETDVQTEPGLEVVIAFPPDPGMTVLAAAAPDVQFLGVDIPGLIPGGNLSAIGGDETLAIQRAFAAGYIAAMLSPDYRVGLITQDNDTGLLVIQAFTNGRAYYCGTCPASFPP